MIQTFFAFKVPIYCTNTSLEALHGSKYEKGVGNAEISRNTNVDDNVKTRHALPDYLSPLYHAILLCKEILWCLEAVGPALLLPAYTLVKY